MIELDYCPEYLNPEIPWMNMLTVIVCRGAPSRHMDKIRIRWDRLGKKGLFARVPQVFASIELKASKDLERA